jgi:hypothetical protein
MFSGIRDLKTQVKDMDMLNASHEDLTTVLDEMETMHEFMYFDTPPEEVQQNVSNWVKNMDVGADDKQEFSGELTEMFNGTMDAAIRFMIPLMQLHAIGFAVSPIVKTRYPDKVGSPLAMFTKEHPVVRIESRIQYLVECAIRLLNVVMKKEFHND